MTEPIGRPPSVTRLLCVFDNQSLRHMWGELTTMNPAERARCAKLVRGDTIRFASHPLTLNGVTHAARQQQFTNWLVAGGTPLATAEAVAANLRPTITYLRYLETQGGIILLREAKER